MRHRHDTILNARSAVCHEVMHYTTVGALPGLAITASPSAGTQMLKTANIENLGVGASAT